MTDTEERYRSYLLRLWQTSDQGIQIWRASLESPATGERKGFASLQDLIDYLVADTSDASPSRGTSRNVDLHDEKI